MKRNNTKTKKGFTIIEVVLVLAIAGLIFLMVFVALPALQRSQRDTQRRDDLARVATAITQFQSNNNGRIPGQGTNATINSAAFSTQNCGAANANDATAILCRYMNSSQAVANNTNDFIDPDGTAYSVRIGTVNGANMGVPAAVDHRIYIYVGARCNGEAPAASGNARDYAIIYKLEGAGVYCADNQ